MERAEVSQSRAPVTFVNDTGNCGHPRDNEGNVYPMLAKSLADSRGLSAMSRAHREILHLGHLLASIVEDPPLEKVDHYLVRDAQRVIEAIEALVDMHTAQEEDIYEAVAAK